MSPLQIPDWQVVSRTTTILSVDLAVVFAQNASSTLSWSVGLLAVLLAPPLTILATMVTLHLRLDGKLDKKTDGIAKDVRANSERLVAVETVIPKVDEMSKKLDSVSERLVAVETVIPKVDYMTNTVQGVSERVAVVDAVGKSVETLRGMTTELADTTGRLQKEMTWQRQTGYAPYPPVPDGFWLVMDRLIETSEFRAALLRIAQTAQEPGKSGD